MSDEDLRNTLKAAQALITTGGTVQIILPVAGILGAAGNVMLAEAGEVDAEMIAEPLVQALGFFLFGLMLRGVGHLIKATLAVQQPETPS
jgi:hypothetical protein